MGKFSKAGIDEAQQTQCDAHKTATSDQFWRFFKSTRKEPQKLNIENDGEVGQQQQIAVNCVLKSLSFNVVKGGYNRFGVFAVLFGLILTLILQARLPAWAHKFGEFPGKGEKIEWGKANYYYNRARALRLEGKFDQSIPLYSKAILIYSSDGTYFFGRGLAYESRRARNDLQKAESDYRKTVELCPDEWQAWECIGHVLYEQGRKSECEPMFLRAIRCNPPIKSRERIEKNILEVRKEIEKIQ